MAELLPCPCLGAAVELTEEREGHISSGHPELGVRPVDVLARVLADPDTVRQDSRFPDTWLFSRWLPDLLDGKHIVVAVVTDTGPPVRYWVVTAYATRRVTRGEIVWQRS
jgi:hypothetical protein